MTKHNSFKGASLTLAAVAASGATANTPDADILITDFDSPVPSVLSSPELASDHDDLLIDLTWFEDETQHVIVAEQHDGTWAGGVGGGSDNIITPTRPRTIGDRFFSGNMMGGLAAIAAVAVLGWGWLRRRRKG